MWMILYHYYLDIPVYYVIAFLGCLLFDRLFTRDKQIDFKTIGKQAVVFCGLLTGILSLPFYPYYGLQCILHASAGYIIGMIGLYYLRYGYYQL